VFNTRYKILYTKYSLWLIAFFLFFNVAIAEELIAPSFRVLDPVFQTGGGEEMTSTSFRLTGSISQVAIGTSTASGFEVKGGFLYFPEVTKPVVTATAGDGQVDLSWTASVGVLGWTVSGYNIGQATISGGPYTYTSAGFVLASTRSGLTNGTTYYFVVRPEDAFGNSIATSTEVSAAPAAAVAPPPPPPAPGGGGIILELLKLFAKPFPPPLPVPPVVSEVEPPIVVCPYPVTDLNCDGRINLQDLSVFLFLEPKIAPNPADFNGDQKVDTRDLSVLFFDWTYQLFSFAPEPEKESVIEEEERQSFLERFLPSLPAAVSELPEGEEEAEAPRVGIFQRIWQFVIWAIEKVKEFFVL